MKITKDPLAFILALVVGTGLVMVIASSVCAQGMANDRVSMMYFLRDVVNEPQTKFLDDTTAARFLNYAQRETQLALMSKSRVTLDTVITSTNIIRYALNTDAMSGSPPFVIQRRNTESGGGEVIMRYVPIEQLVPTGAQSPGGWYSMQGQNMILGASPNGDDTLFIYYTSIGIDLAASDSAMSVAEEDELAVVMYAATLVALRDRQLQWAGFYYRMWTDHLAIKGVYLAPPQKVTQ